MHSYNYLVMHPGVWDVWSLSLDLISTPVQSELCKSQVLQSATGCLSWAGLNRTRGAKEKLCATNWDFSHFAWIASFYSHIPVRDPLVCWKGKSHCWHLRRALVSAHSGTEPSLAVCSGAARLFSLHCTCRNGIHILPGGSL